MIDDLSLRLLSHHIERFPAFDPNWEDAVQAAWWRCWERLWERVKGMQSDELTAARAYLWYVLETYPPTSEHEAGLRTTYEEARRHG